ncbi:hypothetical protein ABEY43_07365 [Priestia megaterium]
MKNGIDLGGFKLVNEPKTIKLNQPIDIENLGFTVQAKDGTKLLEITKELHERGRDIRVSQKLVDLGSDQEEVLVSLEFTLPLSELQGEERDYVLKSRH